ncbi:MULTISPECIES: hypothetical protein [unclassified Pseudomonas]|uniref:hypothetical protein n=1 Tax=unclassified Pseudomonas TaxID=196821 RepID=UPI00257B022E|nr:MULTISPECIES: hypothetical protein [unclassified Pseudomonas]
MTEFNSWPGSLQIAFFLAPFVIGAVGLGVHYHLAGSRHFEALCSAFKNSPGVIEDLRYWTTVSIRTKAMIVAGITLGAICPTLVVRRGWLNAEDCRNCPIYLKRRLQFSFWCTAVAAIWIMAGWALIELGKPPQ